MHFITRLLAIWVLFIAAQSAVWAADKSFVLATTTSTENSGLLETIIPQFTEKTGIDIKVVAVGTGQALELGRRGDAAALLTHDRMGENEFIASRHGADRRDVMFNDFVVVGPPNDPASVLGSQSTEEAFSKLANSRVVFVSRGDDSGTHRKERRLWQEAQIDPGQFGDWYLETGSGMGQTLITTMETGGYTLSDRATWTRFGGKQDYIIVFEQSPPLFNPYSSMLVTHPSITPETKGYAQQWHEWLISPAGQQAIAAFRVDGKQLFFIGEPLSPG